MFLLSKPLFQQTVNYATAPVHVSVTRFFTRRDFISLLKPYGLTSSRNVHHDRGIFFDILEHFSLVRSSVVEGLVKHATWSTLAPSPLVKHTISSAFSINRWWQSFTFHPNPVVLFRITDNTHAPAQQCTRQHLSALSISQSYYVLSRTVQVS